MIILFQGMVKLIGSGIWFNHETKELSLIATTTVVTTTVVAVVVLCVCRLLVIVNL